MGKFLYVFTQRDRDELLRQNYVLLKSDETKNIYIFENNGVMHFDLNGVNVVQSDILTF